MATEHNNKWLLYAQSDASYQRYQEASGNSEVTSADIPTSDLSSAPQQQHYEPQPQWQPSYKVQPGQKGKITSVQRLLLALISVDMIALFSMIVLTSTQNTSTGLIGVGVMCGSIFLVNLVFNQRE